jgi:hypothetical protein
VDLDPDERGTEEDPMRTATHAPRTTPVGSGTGTGRTAARVVALAAGAGLMLAVPGAAWASVPPPRPATGTAPAAPPPHVHPVRVTAALPVRSETSSAAVTWTSVGSTSLTV